MNRFRKSYSEMSRVLFAYRKFFLLVFLPILCVTVLFLVSVPRTNVKFCGFSSSLAWKCLNFSLPNTSLSDLKNDVNLTSGLQNPDTICLTYSSFVTSFPWDEFEALAAQYNTVSELRHLAEELISGMTSLALTPPLIAINESCSLWPNPTRLSESIIKQLHPNCSPRSSPVRIGVLINLGFDADSLEIHMRESSDLVDRYIITESTRTHAHAFRKPLVWDRLKEQSRFSPFVDKVVHFVVDDADLEAAGVSVDFPKSWDVEKAQERIRWTKFLAWNNATQYFRDNDLLSFGDADEVASRKVIEILRFCEVEEDPVDVGIWFPFGRIDRAFESDFPVKGYPYTLGDPTFWRLQTALHVWMNGEAPTRLRGESTARPLFGGMHLSSYFYLPSHFLHSLASTEGGVSPSNVEWMRETYVPYNCGPLRQVQRRTMVLSSVVTKRLVPTTALSYNDVIHGKSAPKNNEEQSSDLPEVAAILPWFLECNLKRYPAWEGNDDPRVT